MADIVSNAQKLNDIEVSSDAPMSETLMSKIGANINWLIDQIPRVTALENRVEGKLLTAAGSGTFLSFTATFGANDFMMLSLGEANAPFSFNLGIAGNGSASQIRWNRNGGTIRSYNGSGASGTITGNAYDKPGAGTFTYTLEGGTSSGSAMMKILKG